MRVAKKMRERLDRWRKARKEIYRRAAAQGRSTDEGTRILGQQWTCSCLGARNRRRLFQQTTDMALRVVLLEEVLRLDGPDAVEALMIGQPIY